MEIYSPRKLMFKAWNKEARLLVRLDSIPCVKGELVKKDHILLQYTGLRDKHHEDIYEMDVVLMGASRFIVKWSSSGNGWCRQAIDQENDVSMLNEEAAGAMVRLCSYFESSE